MKKTVIGLLVSASLVGVALPSMAEETYPKLSPLHFNGNWEVGQIEQAFSDQENTDVDKELLNRTTVWVLQAAQLAENAKASLGFGGGYFFVYPRTLGLNPFTHTSRSGFGLTEANGEITFLREDDNKYWLRVMAGVFNYKYNPEAKNLGEYMFRTWTYPTVITTGGLNLSGSAFAQLSGFKIDTRKGGFTNDAILSIQSGRAPATALSFTDIATYQVGGFLTLGAGFMFDSFYGADEEAITPTKQKDNQYYKLSNGVEMAAVEYADRLAASPSTIPAGVVIVDTSYYSLAGQKAMGRFTLDLGNIIGEDFSKQSPFKLYGEAIVLGLKDYPTFYTDIMDRLVLMAGIEVPTFGILDMLAFEYERCTNPYPNTTRGANGNGLALPYFDAVLDNFPDKVREFHRDDVKWTLYAKKEIVKGMNIHFQAANDHLRMLDVYSTADMADFLITPKHWYWVTRFEYSI
jgi:hypothetical protein